MSTADDTQRKPIRMSEVALALATRKPSVPTSDVALSLNAKGDVQIAVQITDPDPVKAQALAESVFDALLAKYPREIAAAPEPS